MSVPNEKILSAKILRAQREKTLPPLRIRGEYSCPKSKNRCGKVISKILPRGIRPYAQTIIGSFTIGL